jgi:hypothetical protein
MSPSEHTIVLISLVRALENKILIVSVQLSAVMASLICSKRAIQEQATDNWAAAAPQTAARLLVSLPLRFPTTIQRAHPELSRSLLCR